MPGPLRDRAVLRRVGSLLDLSRQTYLLAMREAPMMGPLNGIAWVPTEDHRPPGPGSPWLHLATRCHLRYRPPSPASHGCIPCPRPSITEFSPTDLGASWHRKRPKDTF